MIPLDRGIRHALTLLGTLAFAAQLGATDLGVYAFARAPAMALPALSPDGRWLSYVEAEDGTQYLLLRSLESDRTFHTLKLVAARERFRWCGWESSEYLLCGTSVPRQVQHRALEETRLYVLEASARKVSALNRTLRDPLRDRIIDLSPEVPGSVLIEYDTAGGGYPSAAEVDVRSGATRLIERARAPITRWIADASHRVRLGVGYRDGQSTLWTREADSRNWRVLATYERGDVSAFGPLAFSQNGESIIGLTAHEGRFALAQMELNDGRVRMLHSDSIYDVTGPLVPLQAQPQLEAVRYLRVTETTHYLDPKAEAVQRLLDQELPARVNVRLQRTLDGEHELIVSSSASDPPSLYLLDRRKLTLRLIGHQYPELERAPLSSTRATKYRARDGQVIPAFLTAPRDAESPMPAILLPHGGPETRDAMRFDPLVQFLATEGFAVLQMNFRGSSGYGIAFAGAGAGQWGGVIHNDITDGARWLVSEGLADPERLCIVGSSFGGFAALLGAARESAWYSCAASFAGISDLLALARANERSQYAQVWRERLGSDGRALWNSSPLARVQFVETPILMMHGTLDAVVPVRQSRRMAHALEKSGRNVRFIERRDCDHDMTVESCRLAWFAELRVFLRRTTRGP